MTHENRAGGRGNRQTKAKEKKGRRAREMRCSPPSRWWAGGALAGQHPQKTKTRQGWQMINKGGKEGRGEKGVKRGKRCTPSFKEARRLRSRQLLSSRAKLGQEGAAVFQNKGGKGGTKRCGSDGGGGRTTNRGVKGARGKAKEKGEEEVRANDQPPPPPPRPGRGGGGEGPPAREVTARRAWWEGLGI